MADATRTPTVAGVAASPSAWGWVLASGAVMLAAGISVLAAPVVTSFVITIALGWILAIVGTAGIVMGLRTRARHRRSLDLVYGIASLAAGVVALAEPASATAIITIGIAVWLGARGVAELVGAARVAGGSLRTLLAVAGIANLLLAIILLLSFPASIAVMGLFVGISLIVAGAVTVAAAVQLRRLA